jgi:hypothetical protein
MKLLAAGLLIGLAIGLGTTALAGPLRSAPAAQLSECQPYIPQVRECVLRPTGDYRIVDRRLDVQCTYRRRPPRGPYLICDRASRPSYKCIQGAEGSLTVWVFRLKMYFSKPNVCVPDPSAAQGYTIIRSGSFSKYYPRTP